MTTYEINIDDAELQQLRAQHEALIKLAGQLFVSCDNQLDEAIAALLEAADAYSTREADCGFLTPSNLSAAVTALVDHYTVDRIRALIETYKAVA